MISGTWKCDGCGTVGDVGLSGDHDESSDMLARVIRTTHQLKAADCSETPTWSTREITEEPDSA